MISSRKSLLIGLYCSDGNLLAVLQENHVELRCLDDEFVVAIAKCGGRPLDNSCTVYL